MKQFLLFTTFSFVAITAFGQTQIGNADFELWDNVGSATEEPQNWSGIKTATGNGTLIAFAPQGITRSADTPTGSGYSVRLQAISTFGTIANGTVTLGRLNVGSTTAADPSNYSATDMADAQWSEAITDSPDSIVWWAKVDLANSNHFARMKATLHDDYNYRDPEDATSSTHVHATAVLNYQGVDSVWQRFSAPFDYSGPVSSHTYILLTFTTNMTPGVGTDGDLVYIDDVQLIYNAGGPVDTDGDGVVDADEVNDGTSPTDSCDFVLASQTVAPSSAWNAADCDQDGVANANDSEPLVALSELNPNNLTVAMDNENNVIVVKSSQELNGTYGIYSSGGILIQEGILTESIPFNATSGMYFIRINGSQEAVKFVKL